MRHIVRTCAVKAASLLIACLIAGTGIAQAAGRPWRLADWSTLSTIDDVQFAPDASRIVYAIGSVNARTQAFVETYHILDLASGRSRALDSGALDLSHVRWAPDGRNLAALARAKGGTQQIWLISPAGAAPKQLTTSQRSVGAFSWSPRGDRLAAIEYVPVKESETEAPFWLDPSADGILATRPNQRTLWLVDPVSGTQRRLVTDSFSFGSPQQVFEPSWSSDESTIAAVRQPTALYGDYERERNVIVDVASGSVRELDAAPVATLPGTSPPWFSPQGSHLATVHTHDGTYAARSDVFVEGQDVSSSLDRDFWSCGNSQLAWTGDTVMATALDGVSMRLFALSASDRSSAHAVTPASGSVEAFSIARDGRIAYVLSTPGGPADIFIARADGSEARSVVHVGVPPELAASTTSVVTWTVDGHDLVGQLTVPAIIATAPPLVVELHGGPQCADDSSFSPLAAYFASNGYAFFRPSPRGSDGYGDWSYKAIRNDFGDGPLRDVLAGVEAVVARGAADPTRAFVEGGSYGGYLTSWVATHSNRFRAAAAQFPVTDVGLDYELSESPNITRRFFGPQPAAKNAETMDRESPVRYAAQMNTPLLLVTGTHDTRAPYVQTIAFYKVLLDYGKDAKLLVYPGMGHGPKTLAGYESMFGYVTGWFAAHGGLALPDATAPR